MSKRDAAEIRRKLYSGLEDAEADARALLSSINKLRHGQLEALNDAPAMIEQTKRIAKAVKKIGDEIERA